MIYLIGIIGFISGFILGQFILLGLLKDKSNEEILKNKKIKFIYGTFNWIVAFITAFTAIRMYQFYILS